MVQSTQETDGDAAITLEVKNRLRQRWIAELNEGNPEPLKHITPVLTDDDLIPVLMNFIAAFPAFSRKLFTMHGTIDDLGSGIGRGEVLIYFIFDDVTLGGTTSSIDIHVTGIPYLEVKAVNRSGQNWVDLRLGTDEFMASHHLLYRVVQLLLKHERKGSITVPEHFGNIPKSTLDKLRSLSAKAMKTAEEDYFNRLFNGKVGTKRYIFFDIETMLPIYIGRLERVQLQLDRFSMGQTKLLFNPEGFTCQPSAPPSIETPEPDPCGCTPLSIFTTPPSNKESSLLT